jgi:predicted RNase H-like HicB family nuclease
MTQFISIIEKEENSLYGVFFPDLDGCVSAGETLQEAVENAPEALEIYCKHHFNKKGVLPVQRNLEAIKNDDEYRFILQNGGLLHYVPLFMSAGRQRAVNISLTEYELAAIDAAALARKITRSTFLVEAARLQVLA